MESTSYIICFPLPDGVFLPCDHGLGFLHQLVCVCVCVLSSHLFWMSGLSVDVPIGVAQEESHTGFLHLPSAVRASNFLARNTQLLFLSLVDREVKFFLCTDDLIVLHLLGT